MRDIARDEAEVVAPGVAGQARPITRGRFGPRCSRDRGRRLRRFCASAGARFPGAPAPSVRVSLCIATARQDGGHEGEDDSKAPEQPDRSRRRRPARDTWPAQRSDRGVGRSCEGRAGCAVFGRMASAWRATAPAKPRRPRLSSQVSPNGADEEVPPRARDLAEMAAVDHLIRWARPTGAGSR